MTPFNGLLLGLGGVALLVGGIGGAHTKVISVLERRAEIGLRRALGGSGGILIDWLGTIVDVRFQGWPVDILLWIGAGGVAATLLIGGIAGLTPALRAARPMPTEALGGT